MVLVVVGVVAVGWTGYSGYCVTWGGFVFPASHCFVLLLRWSLEGAGWDLGVLADTQQDTSQHCARVAEKASGVPAGSSSSGAGSRAGGARPSAWHRWGRSSAQRLQRGERSCEVCG